MSPRKPLAKTALLTLAVAMSASTIALSAAQAQDYDNAPPPNYNGGDVPPPPGYADTDRSYDQSEQARDQDRRYEEYSERWSAQNCVDQRNNNTVAGAVIGGVFGAALGAGVAGRHNQGEGALLGGALGAATGAAVGSSSSGGPGCPPGYVVRGGAPAFAPGPVYGADYAYAAPAWYRPWVWYGGRWVYRPYPYHREYYRHYRGDGAWQARHREHQQERRWEEHHGY